MNGDLFTYLARSSLWEKLVLVVSKKYVIVEE